MINGVLVERTVGDVLPTLQSNSENMNKALEQLAKQYKSKQDDMEKWKASDFVKYWYLRTVPIDTCRRRRTRSRSCSSETNQRSAHQSGQ